MPITLGSNIASLQAQRRLNQSTDTLARGFERLGSGMRINRASDDAAGLAIASTLRSDSRVFTQGIRNLNDGISLIAIAQGALTQLASIITRQKELAEQAANGTYSTKQRMSLDKESDALVDEYNRIIRSTSFNGQYILDGNNDSVRLQHGAGAAQSTLIDVGKTLGVIAGDGTFASAVSRDTTYLANVQGISTGDIDEDGNIDVIVVDGSTTAEIFYGNGDGAFRTQSTVIDWSLSGFYGYSIPVTDINGDGHLDLISQSGGNINVFLGNGDGTFKDGLTSALSNGNRIRLGDLNGDGALDIVDTEGVVLIGNGDGTFKNAPSITVVPGIDATELSDINNDGKLDIVSVHQGGTYAYVYLGNGDGTFSSSTSINTVTSPYDLALKDFDGDGNIDLAITQTGANKVSVRMGNGDGTFRGGVLYDITNASRITTGDYNGDGYLDIATPGNTNLNILFGNGNGSFRANQISPSGSWAYNIESTDLNKDGVLDLLYGNFLGTPFFTQLGNQDPSGRRNNFMEKLDLRTTSGARVGLDKATEYLDKISLEISALGAQESRLTTSLNILATTRDNYITAAGRISDADIAFESANLIRSQILQKTAASVFAQANKQPDIAVLLLG